MKLRDLPGYPSEYVSLAENGARGPDLLRDRAAAAASARHQGSFETLARAAEQAGMGPNARRSLDTLEQPESVAVVAMLQPALYGGLLAQLLTCLTAIRLARELQLQGRRSVAVVTLGAQPSGVLEIVDSEGALVPLTISLTADGLLPPEADRLIDQIAEIYSLRQNNPESLRMLAHAYSPGVSVELATRRLLAQLLEPWGALVADGSGAAMSGQVVRVAGPGSLQTSAHAADDGTAPWPSASATLVDARSRKMMERYGLVLQDLFAGKSALLARVDHDVGEGRVLSGLDRALTQIDGNLGELAALVPPGDALVKNIGEAKVKMKYQLDKVRERYAAAVSTRREVAARQLERLCNSLAPVGQPQELRIGAVHFVLRYSRAVLGEILERIDPYSSEHQQIALD